MPLNKGMDSGRIQSLSLRNGMNITNRKFFYHTLLYRTTMELFKIVLFNVV